jgi:hypothetical protein
MNGYPTLGHTYEKARLASRFVDVLPMGFACSTQEAAGGQGRILT